MKKFQLCILISMAVLVNRASPQQVIKDKSYEVLVPDEWTQTSNLPQGMDVGFKKSLQQGEMATFFFHYEFMPPEAGDPPTDTSDMQNQWDTMVRNKYPGAQIVNRNVPKVEGRILINGTYELTDNGDKVRRRYTYFLSERTAFVVQCSAPPSEWPVVLSDFDKLIASLKAGNSKPSDKITSDSSAQDSLKSNLPTLLGSFPSVWACSLNDVSISADSARMLEIKIAFNRSDIRDIFKATKLMFEMTSAGKSDADLQTIPDELRSAASNSSAFIKYVGQVWGLASGYVAGCNPPVGQYRVSVFDNNGTKIGTVSISRKDGTDIISGKVTADEAKRIAGMYKFDAQDNVKTEANKEPNEPNGLQTKTESSDAAGVITYRDLGISFTVPRGIELYDSNRPGPLASQISSRSPFFLVNPAFTEENINVKVSEGITAADIDGLKTVYDENPSMPIPGYKRISVSLMQIGKKKNIKAVQHIFLMKGNIMGQMRQITFVIGNHGFTVTCGTTVDRFDAANKNFFEPFFQSIDSIE